MSSPKITQSLLLLLLSTLASAIPQLVWAQQPATLPASGEPLDTELLKPDSSHNRRDIVTANTISQTSLSVPSLWWAKEQFNEVGGKLINNWIAYQERKAHRYSRQPPTLDSFGLPRKISFYQ